MTLGFQTASPKDVFGVIFSFLDIADLTRCACVNTHWNKIVSDTPQLWIKAALKLDIKGSSREEIKAIFEAAQAAYVKSHDEIIERLEFFLSKVSLGMNGRLRCIFSAPDCGNLFITVEIKGSRDPLPPHLYQFSDFDIKEDYFASHRIAEGALAKPITEEEENQIESLALTNKLYCFRPSYYSVCILKSIGPFRAVLNFPTLMKQQATDLEKKIELVLWKKIEELEAQDSLPNFVLTKLKGFFFKS